MFHPTGMIQVIRSNTLVTWEPKYIVLVAVQRIKGVWEGLFIAAFCLDSTLITTAWVSTTDYSNNDNKYNRSRVLIDSQPTSRFSVNTGRYDNRY